MGNILAEPTFYDELSLEEMEEHLAEVEKLLHESIDFEVEMEAMVNYWNVKLNKYHTNSGFQDKTKETEVELRKAAGHLDRQKIYTRYIRARRDFINALIQRKREEVTNGNQES